MRGEGDVAADGEGGSLTLMVTDPSTFDSSPRRAESREDFPAPTAPTTASSRPWGTVRFILATQEGRCVPAQGPVRELVSPTEPASPGGGPS